MIGGMRLGLRPDDERGLTLDRTGMRWAFLGTMYLYIVRCL